jgi:hypothetical protein
MIPVKVLGTPMIFTLPPATIDNVRENFMAPGTVYQHPSIGPLRCEQMKISPRGDITEVSCSVMDNKKKMKPQ